MWRRSTSNSTIENAAGILLAAFLLLPLSCDCRLLGFDLEMSREAAHRRLQSLAHFDHADQQRQEVWSLDHDRRFSSVIVGFDRNDRLRFVTVIARSPVRYDELIDTRKAQHATTGSLQRYTVQRGECTLMAIGTERGANTFTIKREAEEEEE